MVEFKIPDDFSKLSLEEQERWLQREKSNKERLVKERLDDTMSEQKQKSKLLRELGEDVKIRPTKKLTSREKIEEERRQADEFISKQKGEKNKEEKEDKNLKELMSDPSLMEQEPPGGYKCMNKIGDDACGEPATTKFVHSGLLGDLPPITLCKDCSKLLKLISLVDKDPGLEQRKRHMKLNKELKKLERERKKPSKENAPGLAPGGKPSLSMKGLKIQKTLQKIAELANKLDANGLHEEANLLDTILTK